MKLRCEYMAKYIIPAVRALVATKLVQNYGLTQIEAAKKMGVSQPAISYYIHSKRGRLVIDFLKKDEKLMNFIDKLAELVYKGESAEKFQDAICELCAYIRSTNLIEKIK